MRRIALALALVCLCATAHASDTYRFRNGVVSVGDSVAALIQRAGQASRVVQLENNQGAAIGERWEYYFGEKLVAIELQGGRVVSISEAN